MPCVDVKATGDNIRAICAKTGTKVSDVADAVGISKTAVYKWINGSAMPTVDNIVILASIFNVRMDDIVAVRIV